MRSKTLNIALLVFVALLNAGVLFLPFPPWKRLLLGFLLLGLAVFLASSLELPGLLARRPLAPDRRRRFSLLRNSTSNLLTEVRRLNWLVVDLDRGFRDPDTGQAEIESSGQKLQEILERVRKNAGKPDPDFDGDDGYEGPSSLTTPETPDPAG